MSWIILFVAGLLEIVWAVGLKYTHGFTRLTPSIITISAMIVSMGMLSYAMKGLPAAIFGIIVFGESANIYRLLSLAMIVFGIIGLKLAS